MRTSSCRHHPWWHWWWHWCGGDDKDVKCLSLLHGWLPWKGKATNLGLRHHGEQFYFTHFIFLYTSCHQYNAGARRSWTISLLKKRMVESCGWRAGERESRGHKEVQVPWQPWEAPPSNYSERSESDHLTRGHLNVTSLTIWSVSKLQGQVLERGVRTVPRRLTQLIGRIRRECCKDWLILLVQTVPFSILSGAVST